MRILRRIIWFVILFPVVFYASTVGLLKTSYFQGKISEKVAQYLEERIQTKVNIGKTELSLFNKLILKDVFLEDQSSSTLFEAKRIAVGFDFFQALRNKWRFNSAEIFTFQINLWKETADSPLNIQYIIDAFASPDSTKKDNLIDLQFNKFNFRSGNFSFRVKDVPPTPGKFNPQDMQVNDFSTKITVNKLEPNKLDVLVNRLTFKEKSGLKVRKISFDLVADKEKARIDELDIELDRSKLRITDLSAAYGDSVSLKPLGKIPVQMKFNSADIYLCDLSAFIPELSPIEDKVNLACDVSGTLDNLNVQGLNLRYFNRLMIKLNGNIQNILTSNPETIFIRSKVTESFFAMEGIERMVNHFSKDKFTLPTPVKQMKTVHFSGEVAGYLDDLTASGLFDTGLGALTFNLTLGKDTDDNYLRGEIASQNLNLGQLLNSKSYGETTFNVKFDAQQNPDKKIAGSVDANVDKFFYNGHDYNNLSLNGKFTQNGFEGDLNFDSSEGKIEGKGMFVFAGEDSEFRLTAKASDLQLDKLNLTKKYKEPLLSFNVNAEFTGNNANNIFGTLSVNNFNFETAKGNYILDNLKISANRWQQEKILSIQSAILWGEIRGIYSLTSLLPAIKNTLAAYLPSMFTAKSNLPKGKENSFSIDLTIEDMTDFSRIFELPFAVQEKTRITGQYNSIYEKFNLEAIIPKAEVVGAKIETMQLALNNSPETIQLDISGINLQKKNRLKYAVSVGAKNNAVDLSFNWTGENDTKYRGEISFNTLFSKTHEQSPLQTKINVRQSELVFNDLVWTLHPTTILLDSANVYVSHFLADHEQQYLKIDGGISHNPEKEMLLELNDIDLEYIFQSLKIKALQFGGMATGFVNVQDIYKTRKLSTHLDVKDFSFNQVVFGDLDLTGKWIDEDQGILMQGLVYKNDSTSVNVNGFIYPVSEEISIDFDAKKTDARFLRKYIGKILNDLTGSLTGHLRLFGDLNNPTVEGSVFAENCRFGIEYLNTYYTFSDTVKCLPDEIRIKDIAIYDEKGKSSLANGYVKHKLFNDFRYSANLAFDDFMIFNANRIQNPSFYGVAYGNGTANLYGTEDIVNIDISMQNSENTRMVLNFMEEAEVMDYDFIRFVSAKKDSLEAKANAALVTKNETASNTDSQTEIKLNLMLTATPTATIDIIMDPLADDKISGYGSGTMQIQYGTKTPLKVLGNYRIDRGKYNFSLQQAIYRNFDIQDGSMVVFKGDPYAAELDVKANYRLTANLGDLDQQLLEQRQGARSNVAVDCVLQLTGALEHPAVSFDLDLPGSTAELIRQVKSYIRTEDMMNRQILYLLVLSRFYTSPEYIREDTRANNDLSFLTSTLSTQLSNMLSSLNDNFQVGTKFHQSYEGEQTSTEMELLLSSQLLNNRLVINGNFGYINNVYTSTGGQNNIPLIGDFDLEYKLTKAGEIRLKGYNHYNYRNYYSITPEMTQGLGILFRKDFNHIYDLFGKNRKKPILQSGVIQPFKNNKTISSK
jgi:hypothetical protein